MSVNDQLKPLLPQVESTTLIYDEFVKIRRDALRLPNHHRYNYYTLEMPAPAVVILCFIDDVHIVLNEEYRHPTGKSLLCCPGGYLSPNEDPLVGARRELLEETGYMAECFTLLGSAFPYPGLSNQKIYYVVAHGAKKVTEPQLEPAEILVTLLKSKQQLREAIKAGQEIDGTMCTALFLYDIL